MAKDLSQVLSAVIREYDIRGIVGEELTPKLSYYLGRAYDPPDVVFPYYCR